MQKDHSLGHLQQRDGRIDGARLVAGDMTAPNGVVHIIDRVPLPARI